MRERSAEVRAVLAPVAFVICLAVLGRAFDTYIQYVFCLCLIAMMIGTALVPLVGYAKVVMLAGGAVAGIGAYVSSLLIINVHVPFLAAALAAALAGTVSGVVLGLPSVRFRGHHLAMVTLVFQALGIIVLREWKGMTGGAEGIRVPRASAFGYVFHDDASSLLLICGFLVVTLVIVGLLLRGSFGKVLRAISSSEVGAVAFGVRAGDYKVAAFALSCTFLSLSGAILAPQLKIIDPESFGLMQSINALAYPIVGGMTSVWGGVVGGGLLRALPEALRSFADFAELAFTLLALLVILMLPSGIVGALAKLVQRARGRRTQVAVPRSRTSDVHIRVDAAAVANEAPSRAPPSAPASPHESLALEARRVSKSYGSLVAVSDVSLQVATGRIHGLIGPNGAGKTTLFNIISGLTALDSGELRLFGADARQAPAFARIGMGVTRTFQHVALFDRLSCLDNVVIGLGENAIGRSVLASFGDVLQGADARRRKAVAQEALDVVGLAGRSADLAGSLSLGDQRRLEVARAIASRPRLLLLDEPVSGVAREDEERLMTLLRELNEKWKLTMLLIEHNIRFVVGCCDGLSVMHQGVIVAEGMPQPVIASEQVQQIYFGKT